MKKKTTPSKLEKRLFLDELLNDTSDYYYSNLPKLWQVEDAKNFCKVKELYLYQQKALERIASVLYAYFGEKTLRQYYLDKYRKLFRPDLTTNLTNRACFWMATGSGKTLVLIKTIEHIDRLMNAELFPKKQIMLLLPKDGIIAQFQNQLDEFNQDRNRKIRLVSLKNYEEEMRSFVYNNEITVFYYRSDLLRDERKESILDYKDYENGGDWYVFLDEAHPRQQRKLQLKRVCEKPFKKRLSL